MEVSSCWLIREIQYNLIIYYQKLTSMINTGYFTSRNEIISWINNLLNIELTKIEQLGSGSVYCHILDAAYPEKVPLNKVKWNAYLEVDFLYNFKILQTAFQRLGIHKFVDTQKLVKAKYQDNLEFIQWMKWQFTPLILEKEYKAQERRANNEVYLLFTDKKVPEPKLPLKQAKTIKNHQNKENKDSKENITKSVQCKSSKSLLQPSRSSQQLKVVNKSSNLGHQSNSGAVILKNHSQSLSAKELNGDFRKIKKQKLEITLKSTLILQERHPNVLNAKVIESDSQECF